MSLQTKRFKHTPGKNFSRRWYKFCAFGKLTRLDSNLRAKPRAKIFAPSIGNCLYPSIRPCDCESYLHRRKICLAASPIILLSEVFTLGTANKSWRTSNVRCVYVANIHTYVHTYIRLGSMNSHSIFSPRDSRS